MVIYTGDGLKILETLEAAASPFFSVMSSAWDEQIAPLLKTTSGTPQSDEEARELIKAKMVEIKEAAEKEAAEKEAAGETVSVKVRHKI